MNTRCTCTYFRAEHDAGEKTPCRFCGCDTYEAATGRDDVVTYAEFLAEKVRFDSTHGHQIDSAAVNPLLKPHQRDIVTWAVEGGRRAIFAAFGLGKSVMQLEILRLTLKHRGGTALIVCPLGVRQEFMRDAKMLNIPIRFVRSTDELLEPGHYGNIFLTNYESVRDGKIDPSWFTAVSLDEASVLRSFGSKTYQTFLPLFADVPYRFVATATPSPNRYKELIHYAGFLGVMDTGQALTRFFQRDSTKANHLTLYPHKEREFWLWLNTWAVFLQRPSELGYPDDGYDLPELDVRWHEVDVDHSTAGADRDGQGLLFRGGVLSTIDAAREKRSTIDQRIALMMEVIRGYVGRGTSGLPAGVLPSQSRTATGTTTCPWPPELQSEARSLCAAPTENCAEEVRADRGLILADARGSGELVPDLQRVDGGPADRPRSSDRAGARSPLSQLQHSAGIVPRESTVPAECPVVPDQIIIWCDLNAEQDAIERALLAEGLTYSSVHGSLSIEEREKRLDAWRSRRTYALIGKPVMLGQGMNFQQCNKTVFLGLTFKFNDFIQAIHRVQRFGQTRRCETHIIYAESEREVVRTLQRKWAEHKELTATMSDVIKEYGLKPAAIADALQRSIGVDRIEAAGDGWLAANNDCVPETESMPDDSVDLIVTSIPFANHYEYTPSYNDFGHTDDNTHFWAQMDYLTPQLLRVLAPGRIYACHVKDRILFGNVTGAGVPTVSPFHAEAIFHGRRHGFDYLGMITVVTDVVRENNQTYRLGWTEQCKDATKMGVGSPEYVLLFHKPQTDRSRGYADIPVTKDKDDYSRARWQVDAHAFWRSSGDRLLTTDEMATLPPEQISRLFTEQTAREVYDYESHVRIGEQLDGRGALPATFMTLAPASWTPAVWHDVNRMLTLNTAQSQRAQQMHVCPLQFDIVDRLITRFTNPGDLVYDPFGGLMTVPVRALKLGRRGRGVELNPGYYFDGVKYLQAQERQQDMPSLFDVEVPA